MPTGGLPVNRILMILDTESSGMPCPVAKPGLGRDGQDDHGFVVRKYSRPTMEKNIDYYAFRGQFTG